MHGSNFSGMAAILAAFSGRGAIPKQKDPVLGTGPLCHQVLRGTAHCYAEQTFSACSACWLKRKPRRVEGADLSWVDSAVILDPRIVHVLLHERHASSPPS